MILLIDIYPGVIVFKCGDRSGSEPLRPDGQPRRPRTEVLASIRAMFPDATPRYTDHTVAPHAPKLKFKCAPHGGSVVGFYREDGTKLFSWRHGDDIANLLERLGKAAGFTAVYTGEMTEAE